MKKIISISLVILTLMLSACADRQPSALPNQSTASQQQTTTAPITSLPPIELNQPVEGDPSWSVNSYEQIASFWGRFDLTETDETNEYGPWYGKKFTALVNRIQSDDAVMIPLLNGEPVPLQSRIDYPIITVFISERFNEPWIWYHCMIDGQPVKIRIMYTDDIDVEVTEDMTASEFIKAFRPTSPNLHNKENYTNREIYETEIPYNGSTVTALVDVYKDSGQTHTCFMLDGMLVGLLTYEESLNVDWAENLSFAALPLTDE